MRKTVTALFCDLVASPNQGPSPDAEVLRPMLDGYFAEVRAAVERHGGRVEKFIGDAVNGVFGLPVAHEDDALRAVRAAVEIGERLAVLAASTVMPFSARVGVNTGEVLVSGDGTPLIGDAMNVAARLQATAEPGTILIGETTLGLIREAVIVEAVAPLVLKGKAEPVPAFRVLALAAREPAARRTDRPMIGREVEMRHLTEAFGEATATRSCRVVTVLGDAGVGKTRLTEAFLEAVSGSAMVVRGRCLPYGDGITFWPVVEMVREAAGIGEGDPPEVARARIRSLVRDRDVTDRVASSIGLPGTSYQVAELFWAIRRFLEILAAERPVVVLFDDLHWAEPTFLELVAFLAAGVHDAPVMILCGSRPELLERHPAWHPGGEIERRIVLSPLPDADAARVAQDLLGTVGLDEAVRDRIVAAAEGNPLFIEQVLSMLVENGTLREVDGRWEAATDLSRLAIPPTIHALLTARIDRLSDGERAVVDPASVVGLVFATAALQSLVEDGARRGLASHLRTLSAKELIRPEPGDEEDTHRFGHILIRDTVYEGLLKRVRATLHERFVAWMDEANRASGRASEFEEILGYHLEQAHRYLVELGTLDGHTADLGIEASRRLTSAGDRVLARGDLPAAVSLIRRAEALLPAGDARRPRLLLQLGEARYEAGEYEAAIETLRAAELEAARLDATELAARARLKRDLLAYLSGTGDLDLSPEAAARDGIETFERTGDDAGLADAWRLAANLRIAALQWGSAGEAFEHVVEHARRAGDGLLERRMAPVLAACALRGRMPAPEVIATCQTLLMRSGGDRTTEARILRVLAQAHSMLGDFDLARAEYGRARRDLVELGWSFEAAITSLDSGPVELRAGDPVAAEAELRRDYEALDKLGERNFISTVAAYLAEALYRQGRDAEADAFATRSAEIAAPDDNSTQCLWRQVRAKVLARRGAFDEAIALADQAVELTRQSDALIDHANALADLAEILAAAGSAAPAGLARLRAIELYEQKGDVAAAGVARGD